MEDLSRFIADHDVLFGLTGMVIVLLAVVAGFHRSANRADREDR